VTLEKGVLDEEAAVARSKSEFETTRLLAEVNDELFKDGLVPPLNSAAQKSLRKCEHSIRHRAEA